MQYVLSQAPDCNASLVKVEGELDYESSAKMLSELWANPQYASAVKAIWDFTDSDKLPDFNDVFRLTHFIGKERNGRGPAYVAFVSPDIAGSLLTGVFEGFDRTVGFGLRFFGEVDEAVQWLSTKAE